MADSTDSKTLLSLPAELHLGIAKYLGNRELRAVHKTCRELAANTVDVFAQQFFRTRTHLWTTESLDALLAISAVPKFARHIEKLVLIVVGVATNEQFVHTLFSHNWEARDAARKAIAVPNHWYKSDCATLQLTGTDRLEQIFSALKKVGAGKSVKLTTDFGPKDFKEEHFSAVLRAERTEAFFTKTGVYGTRRFMAHLRGWAEPRHIGAGNIEAVGKQLYAALGRTGHLLESLDVGYDSRWPSTGRWRDSWNIRGSQLAEISTSWSNLTVLKLDIGLVTGAALDTLLFPATGLRELSLRTSNDEHMALLRTCLRKHTLTSFTLSGMCNGVQCEPEDLMLFVAGQARSLKHLHFSQVKMIGPDHGNAWNDFFLLASKRLGLRSLSLSNLYELPDDRRSGYRQDHFLPDGETHRFFAEGDERWMKGQMETIVAKGNKQILPEVDDDDPSMGNDPSINRFRDLRLPLGGSSQQQINGGLEGNSEDISGGALGMGMELDNWQPESVEYLQGGKEWQWNEDHAEWRDMKKDLKR